MVKQYTLLWYVTVYSFIVCNSILFYSMQQYTLLWYVTVYSFMVCNSILFYGM